jgi:hypothetical protein
MAEHVSFFQQTGVAFLAAATVVWGVGLVRPVRPARAVAYGWRTEWCAACHLCYEDGDSFVPDYWGSSYDVPEALDLLAVHQEHQGTPMSFPSARNRVCGRAIDCPP